MYSIFHEKQEGFLCAQHCLNALLQNNYFNAVDLATLANQLDEEEKLELSRGGIDSKDYLDYIANGSQNMDDSGYFSIQVICKALEVWGLELVSLTNQDIISPEILFDKKAFICHFRQHWLTIRRIGHQWFNLNSLLNGPQLLTETYLCLYLTQLRQEGYIIFAVNGNLPSCDADEILSQHPVEYNNVPTTSNNLKRPAVWSNEDWDYNQAVEDSIKLSENQDPTLQKILHETMETNYEESLASAIAMSLENHADNCETKEIPTREIIRAQRQKFLDNISKDFQ